MPYDDRRIVMVAMGPGGDPITFWNARYGEPGFAYGDQPNDFLRERAQRLPPGQALCLAEGEGRNAVHLAELGHTVTAQDISPVGLAKAERLAAARGVSITTLCCDLVDFQPEPRSTDLVVAIWMHLPEALRSEVHRRAAAALRPGGHLILEAHTPRQLALGTGGPRLPGLLLDPEALRRDLDGLELLVLEEQERWVHEGRWHQGHSAVVRALARKHA